MADETNASNEATEETTDWEAKYKQAREHSREWERRAKANEAAAKELEQLRAASMSEQEQAEQRAQRAEAELEQLRAEAKRRSDADEVSAKTGVPVSMLLYCSDREAMEAFAEEYAGAHHVPAAPSTPESRIVRPDGAKPSNREMFAELLGRSFNQ